MRTVKDLDINRAYWNQKFETMPREELRQFQRSVLPGRINKAYREGELYRRIWGQAGGSANSDDGIEALARVPPVTKDMVRAYREETGDPFGGLVGKVRPASIITRSSGTSGTPTFFSTSPGDIDLAADEIASYMWSAGLRPGQLVMHYTGTGTRADAPMQRAMGLIGISQIVGDVTKPTVYLAQLEFLRPFAINVFAGFVETLERAALELRHDFQRLIDPVQVVFFMGKHLDPSSRRRLQALTNAQIFEIGGLGDIGLWMSECQAHDGLHVREDMFFVETIDSATGESQSLENPNELVFTSLWEESMNYVRWRSDDIGVLKTEPCICGRTTGRLLVLGRVWERTAIGNSTFLPQQIEDVLSELLAEEPFFQIVRHRNGRRAELRVSLPSDFSTDDVSLALAEQLGIEIEAQSVDKETIVAGSPFYKYRQVVDVD